MSHSWTEALPAGWARLTLGEACRWGSGGTPRSGEQSFYGGQIPWAVIGDLTDGVVSQTAGTITEAGLANSSAKWVEEGSVLVAMYGSIGKLGIAGCRLTTNQAIAFAQSNVLDHRYLFWYLASIRSQLIELGKGGTQQNISQTVLKAVPVPVPPLTEQRRIVAALEEHLSDLDAAVAGLGRAKANALRYRTAVISAAVLGALDSDSPIPAEVADLRLPSGWQWVALRDASAIKGGVTKGQKRRADDQTRVVPYLRVANVQRGYLDLREVKRIEATESEIEELRLQPGDVLFNEGGDRDKLGRGWVWSGEIEECIHQNHVFRARVDVTRFNPKFVSYYGNTWGQRYFLDQGKQTTNLASINLTKLGGLQIPEPPREVQDAIVDRLEQRLAIADRTAADIDVQLARAARLRQSILKGAFEGKLVPQDPTDEPASELLARVSATPSPTVTPAARSRGIRTRTSTRRGRT